MEFGIATRCAILMFGLRTRFARVLACARVRMEKESLQRRIADDSRSLRTQAEQREQELIAHIQLSESQHRERGKSGPLPSISAMKMTCA